MATRLKTDLMQPNSNFISKIAIYRHDFDSVYWSRIDRP